MSSSPEIDPPNDEAGRNYTSSSNLEIKDLLLLPQDNVPRLILDIGVSGLSGQTLFHAGHHWFRLDISQSTLDAALGREVGDRLVLRDMGQGLGVRPLFFDGAISTSALQWLFSAHKSSHDLRERLKAFFESLYRSLSRGSRAVLQVYPENDMQPELILSFAIVAGFAGDVVIDYPHSSGSGKVFLVLTSCPPSLNTAMKNKYFVSDWRRLKLNEGGKEGREWVLNKLRYKEICARIHDAQLVKAMAVKKEQMRIKGNTVCPD